MVVVGMRNCRNVAAFVGRSLSCLLHVSPSYTGQGLRAVCVLPLWVERLEYPYGMKYQVLSPSKVY